MDRLSIIAGWLVGLLLLVGLLSLIPPPTCRDGWRSPSIGRQGACSHHGGVERHSGLAFMAVAVSFGAGFLVSAKLSGVIERRKKDRFKRSLTPPPTNAPADEVIIYAILSESKIEFMYKGRKDFVPAQRIVTPTGLTTTGGRFGKAGTPCVVGYCHIRNAARIFTLDRIQGLKLHRV